MAQIYAVGTKTRGVKQAIEGAFQGRTFNQRELEFVASYMEKHGLIRNNEGRMHVNALFCEALRHHRNWYSEIDIRLITRRAHLWMLGALREIRKLIADGIHAVSDGEVIAVAEFCLEKRYIIPEDYLLEKDSKRKELDQYIEKYKKTRNERLSEAQFVL